MASQQPTPELVATSNYPRLSHSDVKLKDVPRNLEVEHNIQRDAVVHEVTFLVGKWEFIGKT